MLCKSSLWHYWSWCAIMAIMHTLCAVSVGMSRDRFLVLLTMFPLKSNNAKAARGIHPLFQIRQVIATLITKFQDVFTPEEQLTIDEAICPFRVCTFFCVYIKGKPHKYRIKYLRQKATKSTTWTYILGHIPPTQHTTWRSVLLTGCMIQ